MKREPNDLPALITQRGDALYHASIPALMGEKCDAGNLGIWHGAACSSEWREQLA
jgi:hypothetical protein